MKNEWISRAGLAAEEVAEAAGDATGTVPKALGFVLKGGGAAGEEERVAFLSLTFPKATLVAAGSSKKEQKRTDKRQ